MTAFMRAGGYSMWIVLILTLACLVAAILFVVRADVRKLALVRALTWASVFSIVSGMCANLAAVFHHCASPEHAGDGPTHLLVLQGLGESMGPGILGFTALSIGWLLVAVGTRRVQDRLDP